MSLDLKPCPSCGDAWVYASTGDYGSGYKHYGYRVNCRCILLGVLSDGMSERRMQ